MKKRIPTYTCQDIIEEAIQVVNNKEKEFKILNLSNTSKDDIEAAVNIMASNTNREYYAPIRTFQLGNLFCIEKIRGKLSEIRLEAECLTDIAIYLFSVINKAEPEEFPLTDPEEILGYINSHKKLLNKQVFIYVVTKCLEDVMLAYSLDYFEENELSILMRAVENTRYELLKTSRYDIEKYIRKKCSKYKFNNLKTEPSLNKN